VVPEDQCAAACEKASNSQGRGARCTRGCEQGPGAPGADRSFDLIRTAAAGGGQQVVDGTPSGGAGVGADDRDGPHLVVAGEREPGPVAQFDRERLRRPRNRLEERQSGADDRARGGRVSRNDPALRCSEGDWKIELLLRC
jgi:hypothetical protein